MILELSREVEAGRDEAANVDPSDVTCGTSQPYGLIPRVLTLPSFESATTCQLCRHPADSLSKRRD